LNTIRKEQPTMNEPSGSHPPEDDGANESLSPESLFLAETGLNVHQLRAIRETMRSTGMSFAATAQQLGLLTSQQIEAVIDLVRELTLEKPSIVEEALRRTSSGRELVLRQGPSVTPAARLNAILDTNSAHGEQIRALRTQLLILNESNRNATPIAIVSPSPGDGRTQLAAELAISFAQLGKRTLLVDADMRTPSLHELFDCHPEFGLSDAIVTNSNPYLHPVRDLPTLHFLSAGNPQQSNPLELLSDNRFARIVRSWQHAYTFVVIDTPATSAYADALAVATLAGRALVLSRAKHTAYKDMKAMMRRVTITQARILGAVLNRF
jgi:protein-tyrosine kinase